MGRRQKGKGRKRKRSWHRRGYHGNGWRVLRALQRIEKAEAIAEDEVCVRCGQTARGYARMGDDRLCHFGPSPTCYEKESYARMVNDA